MTVPVEKLIVSYRLRILKAEAYKVLEKLFSVKNARGYMKRLLRFFVRHYVKVLDAMVNQVDT